MEKHKEEIDLIYILVSIKNGFSNFFSWIYETSIKRFLTVALFGLVGIGIGVSVFSFKQPVYLSELTVSHVRFSNDQCNDLINNLTKLNGNQEQLAKILQMNSGVAGKVKSITYLPLNSRMNKLYNDSASVISPFKVAVEVYDPTVFDTLQNKILTYLENNEYGVRRREIDKENFQRYINKLQNELTDIDTLKKIVNKSILQKNQGNGALIDEPIDPVKITQKSVELYDSKLKLEKQMKLNDSFELMIGFNGGVRKTANLTLSMLYGFLASYLLSLIWIYRKEKKAR